VHARRLREASIGELSPLLDEEARRWQSELFWDFSEARASVASGIEKGTLRGRVLSEGRRPVAYCYYLVDSGRAVIGSIFASRGREGRGLEEELVDAVIADAREERGSRRVECQTLFSTAPGASARFAQAGFEGRARHYLVRELGPAAPAEPLPTGYTVRPLRRSDLHVAAEIIYRSHVGSLDAALNLTYATPSTCRTFVDTIALRSGCGRWDTEASLLASGPRGPAGVVLASRLARATGHICQVSVVPEAQGAGLGRALMLAALRSFHAQGLAATTLSVTVENARAYGLYMDLGFRVCKEFAAHAWVRPPARIAMPA
jgi:ribosomal protein S18 acetylase RimI-like enzyme